MISIKHKIKCFINFLPSTEFDWDCIKIDEEKKFVYIRHLFEFHSSLDVKVLPKFWCFKTDGVFMNCCQSEVYATVIDRVIENVFLGVDNVLMSYGQNFSGKTFCLSGFHNQYELRGIVPRFITDLFLQKKALELDFSTHIWVSSVDIDGDNIYDLLLKPIKCCRKAKEVKKIKLKSEMHCWELLFQAESKRMTVEQKTYNAHTASNIITFIIETVSLSSNEPNDRISKVHFLDLAGVETINRNPATSFKEQPKQGRANVTKTLLEVFSLRCQGTNQKSSDLCVNKRIHTVTQYLDKSFFPVSNIVVMCHLRPNHEDLMITLSLLKFSMIIRGLPMQNPEHHLKANNEMTVRNLQLEIESLKDELFLRNLWGERSPMKISQDRVGFVRRSVKSFLNGNLTELELLSVVEDCSLILSFVKDLAKEDKLVENPSMASQTDETDFFFVPDKEGGDKPRKSITRGSVVKEKASSSIANSSRRVSFEEKPKKASKTEKTKKGKSEKTSSAKSPKGGKRASKVQEKPVLVSQEVQVNLIEPNSKMPKLDSREGLWAEFMISRPEIQVFLDKLNKVVEEKNKSLNSESVKFDDVNHSLREKQMALDKLASFRHIDHSEVYDIDGRVIVPEEESGLVKEIKTLQKDFEVSQQRVTEAQTDWLDALERMNCEKQIIEQEFKQFCISNELLVLNQATSSQQESSEHLPSNVNEDLPQPLGKENIISSEVLTIPTETTAQVNGLQEKYTFLQKKYLANTSHFL